MKARYLILFIHACALSSFFSTRAQAQLTNDVNQYMMYQPFINYAASASYEGFNGSLYYRNQWVGFNGAPQNFGMQISLPSTRLNSTFGLRAIQDEIGVRNTTSLALNYAYRFKLNSKSYLSLALSPMVRFFQGQYEELIINNQQDPIISAGQTNQIAPNFEFGTYFFRDRFYVGLVIPHLLVNNPVSGSNAPTTSFQLESLQWMIHSGYEWKFKRKQHLNASVLVKSAEGASLHAEINTLYSFLDHRFGIGASYRTSKDIVALARMKIIPQLSLSYGYQYTFSNLSNFQSGSHELMLVYDLPSKIALAKLNVPRF